MCHSFETYDPKIAMREIEERLSAPAPRLASGLRAALSTALALLRGRVQHVRAGLDAGPRGREALE